MNPDSWIKRSQRAYRRLLQLYPRAHRDAYEMEMYRLFTNQCRDACQHGGLGVLALWVRTLADLVLTVTREHLADPDARLGLLEGAPGKPLPWKGTLLVLIPGLVFFVSQVVQLTTLQDWYFSIYYRAAFILIAPVLLVWLLTRRFPVWGLIPLGLLAETLWILSLQLPISRLPIFRELGFRDILVLFDNQRLPLDTKDFLRTLTCTVILLGLLVYARRSGRMSDSAWRWLGLYALLITLQISGDAWRFVSWQGPYPVVSLRELNTQHYLLLMPFQYLSNGLVFLVLVFVGLFFARKHGTLSFLVLLGFLMPTVIFGRYGVWNEPLPFAVVTTAVLLYRFTVALAAPVWLARAASIPGRRRAAAIPVAIAIVCQITLTLIAYLAAAAQTGYQPTAFDLVLAVSSHVILAAGLGLAVALYLPAGGDRSAGSSETAVAWAA